MTVTTCRLEPARCGDAPRSGSVKVAVGGIQPRWHRGAQRRRGARRRQGAWRLPAATHGTQPHLLANQGVGSGSRPHAVAGRLPLWPEDGSGVAVRSEPWTHPPGGQGAGQGDQPGTTWEKANHPSPSPFSHHPFVQNTHRKMLPVCSANASGSHGKRTRLCADRASSVSPLTDLPPTLNATSFPAQSWSPA